LSDAPITLACLDMAGTTVTDDGAVASAFAEALGAGGIEPDTPAGREATSYIRETMGQSKIEVFGAIFDGDKERARAANLRFERSYAESVAGGKVGSIPGAEEAIAQLRAFGIKVCLTTGFAPETRDSLIDALGWRDRIDLALSPADCGRGRPYPDMILHAVIALQIEAVASVAVVGDTTSDVLAGRRAGASLVVGVLTGAHRRSDLEMVAPTHIVPSIADFPALLTPDRLPPKNRVAHS
jgi:phosphoglycolate phosphatase